MRISDVFKEEIGIGGVVSLLWFKRRLPPYACKFLEMVLMLTADHVSPSLLTCRADARRDPPCPAR